MLVSWFSLVNNNDASSQPLTKRNRNVLRSHITTAGDEIFLDYGYCKHGKGEPDWVDHVYVTGDYSKAATLIWRTLDKASSNTLEYDSDNKLIPPKEIEKLVLELLPKTTKELKEIEKTVESKTDLVWYLAENRSLKKHTPKWIRENGMCMENLLPLKSTLPHAGFGAFSQYHIKRDEIVIPAPLLQILDKDVLTVYKDGEYIGNQLLLNYCFGHPQSSLLLCPDTQAELINHCSKRTKQCGRAGPNAAIRWSRGWDPTSDAWREKSLKELGKEGGRGLAFEVYALRDIQAGKCSARALMLFASMQRLTCSFVAGEEVFIDYGIEWEAAWVSAVPRDSIFHLCTLYLRFWLTPV